MASRADTDRRSSNRRRAAAWACATLLLIAFVVQCVAFAYANGQTYDEAITLAAGFRLLRDHRNDLNVEHPPLAKEIAALPVWLTQSPRLDVDTARRGGEFALGRTFLYESGVPFERLLTLGRAPMIALATMLVALTGWWAKRLWGAHAAILALALAAFDPNLVAHGSLIGHDAPLALFAALAFYATSELCETRRVAWLGVAGVASGLALATKHSGALVLVSVVASLGVRAAFASDVPAWWAPEKAPTSRARAVVAALGNALLVGGVALVTLRATLGADGYAPYLAGLHAQIAHQANGHPAFFLGAISRSGWPAYFPVAIALKEPPLTLVLLGVSLVAARRGARFSRSTVPVLIPLGLLFAALLFVHVDIGVRYALPLFPLIIVLASRVATFAAPSWLRAALALTLSHHALAAMRVAPHDLAFFSDFAGGPSRGHAYLSDSNLDWGQDIRALGQWLASREAPDRLYLAYFGTAPPEAYGVAYRPAPSSCPHAAPWLRHLEGRPSPGGRQLLAVSATTVQGAFFFDDPRAYAWVDDRRPVAVLGWSIAVYDITGDAAAHLALAQLYERFGPRDLAVEERALASANDAAAPLAP